MNDLLEKAFESLSFMCNKSSLHALDEDRIKVTLRVLHKKGAFIDIPSLEDWLIENDWQQNPRKSIVAWAKTVSGGGQVRIKHKENAPTEKEVWDKLNS